MCIIAIYIYYDFCVNDITNDTMSLEIKKKFNGDNQMSFNLLGPICIENIPPCSLLHNNFYKHIVHNYE